MKTIRNWSPRLSLCRSVLLFLFGALLLMLLPAGLYAQELNLDVLPGIQLESLPVACSELVSTCSIDDIASSSPASPSDENDWVHRWLSTVDKTKTLQPHYVAPLITTHVLLVQQFRYDMYWQEDTGGNWAANYGAAKGLEIIPNSRIEVQVGVPPYIVHETSVPDGFGDVSLSSSFAPFLRLKEKATISWGLSWALAFLPEIHQMVQVTRNFPPCSQPPRDGAISIFKVR